MNNTMMGRTLYQCGKVITLMAALTLAGCQWMSKPTNRVTLTPQTGKPVLAAATTLVAPTDEGVRKQLATCLFEAEQLLKLNRERYQAPVSRLYENIRAAKYYASVASRLNTGATDTLTPMFQFKVNDSCDTISQLLLSEFKQGHTVEQSSPK